MTWTYSEFTHNTHATLSGFNLAQRPSSSAKPGTTLKTHSFYDEESAIEIHDNRNTPADPHVLIRYHIKPELQRGYTVHTFIVKAGAEPDVKSNGPQRKDNRQEIRKEILAKLENREGHARPAELRSITAFFRKHTKNLQP